MSSYCLVQFALHASNQASKLHTYKHNTIISEVDHGTVYTIPDGVVN